MKVALGFKSHSGWAALVALGKLDGQLELVRRARIPLVEENELWAKQPYHAAEGLDSKEARLIVKRGVDAATCTAKREVRKAVKELTNEGHQVKSCGLLVGSEMPDWSVDEILAVHFRMHKAEGVLFRDVIEKAAADTQLKCVTIPEKTLLEYAQKALNTTASNLVQTLTALGKSAGPPWGKDQRDAALAAMIALDGRPVKDRE
jgi:hypothetical protein